ncbi:MAG TPA: alanine--glyoxylate aminotransferase family protein [Chthoniobacteraceae bacterium]|nr:alanine--glyoxylate aminotransferase family protein [Chthoniobacteraceae bacterium]
MSLTPHTKLFIPGPVEVSQKTFEALCKPMIGHRSNDFKKLYGGMQPRLQQLFGTGQPVFLSTSSAWGVMEGAIRNLVAKKVLNCMNGAFSDKWMDVSRRCGKQAEGLQVDWGCPILPEALDAKLATGEYDVVTLIHNETSTGVMNPLKALCEVVARYPDVLLVVDTVSSFSVVPIDMDALGIDVLLTGSQKALALPPGLALFSVSERAFERAATLNDRGYYFDFLEFKKNQASDMTPSTPAIPHIYALASKLDDIFAEGVENRYARHARLNALVHAWVNRNGFEFFAPEGYRSLSLTCVKNNREIDVPALNNRLKERYHAVIDGGYGKIKGQTFRISNMGDETDETISTLLGWLDDCLE